MAKNKVTILDKAKCRLQKPTDNLAVKQAKEYFSELGEAFGKLIWLLSFRLVKALIKGVLTGVTVFFQEMAEGKP